MTLIAALSLLLTADSGRLVMQMGQDGDTRCTLALTRAQAMEMMQPDQALAEAQKAVETSSIRDELDVHLTADGTLGPLDKSRVAHLRDCIGDCIRDAEILTLKVLKAGASKSPEAKKKAIAAHEAYLVRYAGHRTEKAVKGWLKELTAAP